MTCDCYRINVFGLEGQYINETDVGEIQGKIYDEDTAWRLAKSLLEDVEESDKTAQIFVTKCTAEVSPDYDVPVMNPEE